MTDAKLSDEIVLYPDNTQNPQEIGCEWVADASGDDRHVYPQAREVVDALDRAGVPNEPILRDSRYYDDLLVAGVRVKGSKNIDAFLKKGGTVAGMTR